MINNNNNNKKECGWSDKQTNKQTELNEIQFQKQQQQQQQQQNNHKANMAEFRLFKRIFLFCFVSQHI